MSYLQRPDPTRRIAGFAAVIVLHAAVVYALATGLGHKAIEVLRQPLETKIITETKPPPPKVVPPPPKLAAPPPPYIPPPEIRIAAPPPPTAITAVTTVKPETPPPPAPVVAVAAEPAPVAAVVRVPPALDGGRPCKPPQYPPISRRNEETGAVILKFLIETDGKVVESKVDGSSGYERLDEAALQALSLCRFKPGTVDGKPERSWARMRYVWKLN